MTPRARTHPARYRARESWPGNGSFAYAGLDHRPGMFRTWLSALWFGVKTVLLSALLVALTVGFIWGVWILFGGVQ